MLNSFTNPVRAMLLAAALTFAGMAAESRADTTQSVATTRSTARSKDDATTTNDGAPVGGLLIIAGIVIGVIVLAWVCSRMGDSRPTMS